MLTIEKFVGAQVDAIRSVCGELAGLWTRTQRRIDQEVQATTAKLPPATKAAMEREVRSAVASFHAGQAASDAQTLWTDAFTTERMKWAPLFAARFDKVTYARCLARPDAGVALALEVPGAPGTFIAPTPTASAIAPQVTAADVALFADLRHSLSLLSSADLRRDATLAFHAGSLRDLGAILGELERRCEANPADEAARLLVMDVMRYIDGLDNPAHTEVQENLSLVTAYGESATAWRRAITENDADRAALAQRWFDRAEAARSGTRAGSVLGPDGRYVARAQSDAAA